MHPDMDWSELLKETYRGELQAQAARERLLRSAGLEHSDRPAMWALAWLPVLLVILVAIGRGF